MGLTKQKFREIVLQILYSHCFTVSDDRNMISFMMNLIKTTKKNVIKSIECVKKILECLDEFDSQIKLISKSYDFDRISKVELSIMRLALYETRYEKIPFQIVISEAVRLTKKFSSQNSVSFIHAILNNAHQKKDENITK